MPSISLGPIIFQDVGIDDPLQINISMRHSNDSNQTIYVLPTWRSEMSQQDYLDHVLEVIDALENLGYEHVTLGRSGQAFQIVTYTPGN